MATLVCEKCQQVYGDFATSLCRRCHTADEIEADIEKNQRDLRIAMTYFLPLTPVLVGALLALFLLAAPIIAILNWLKCTPNGSHLPRL